MMSSTRAVALAISAGLAVSAGAQTDIFWNAGSGAWSNAGNWSPVNVPDNASENARIGGVVGRQVFYDITAQINILEVGAGTSVFMDPGRLLALTGPLLNDGFISLNATDNVSDAVLRFDANTTMSGSGILRLSGGGNDAQITTNGTTVTNALGHTIDGAGTISGTLINNGVITALPTGFGNQLILAVGTKSNNLNMQAAADADLFITNVIINQDPAATIAANAGGTVTFDGNATINNGRLVGPGGLHRLGNGVLALNSASLEAPLAVDPGAIVVVSGNPFNCTSTITINDSASATNALIRFDSNTLLTGGGTVFLAGSSNDSQLTTNGTTITIDSGFTVEGSGEIPATLVSNGLIRAFPSTNGDGRITLFAGAKTNNALMVAEPGGELFLSAVSVNQGPAGVLLADGGAITFSSNVSLVGGTLRSSNGGVVTRLGNGTLTLNGTAIEADLLVDPASNVVVLGNTFDCSGSVILNDTTSANNALLRFDSNTTLTGGGRVFLAGSESDSALATNGTTITIASDFTVEGSGEVSATLINNGLIRAVPSINGDGRINLFVGPKTNNTLIVADPGGEAFLSNVTVNQGPDGLILADGGAVTFNGNVSLSGGTLSAVNGGTLTRLGNGTLIMTSTDLRADLAVDAAGTVVYLGNTLDCDSTIILNDSGSANNAVLRFDSNTTLTGGGSVFLAGSGNDSQLTTNGTTITIAPDFTVEGSGDVLATLINNGFVRAFPSDNGDGRLDISGGPKTNNALMVAEPGGELFISNATVNQGAGGIVLADGGNVTFNANAVLSGGTLADANGGTITRLGNGTLTMSGLTLEGTLNAQGAAFMNYTSPSFVNNGTVLINSNASAADVALRFDANTVVSGNGEIILNGPDADAQLTNNGTSITLGPGQTLRGLGRITGVFTVQGRIQPGGVSVGTIRGNGTLNLAGSTVIEAETDGPGSGDRLDYFAGAVNVDGTVAVRLAGYVPQVNDEFTLVSAPTVSGIFDDVFVDGGGLPVNIAVRPIYTGNAVLIRFVCISDLAAPFGVLDLADVNGFVQAFLAQDPVADIAEPIGLFDLSDIQTFIQNFLSGCN